jgi:hypothetical protein
VGVIVEDCSNGSSRSRRSSPQIAHRPVCAFVTLRRFGNSRKIETKELTISFATVSYTIDSDSPRPIIHGVQNAIVAYTMHGE